MCYWFILRTASMWRVWLAPDETAGSADVFSGADYEMIRLESLVIASTR